MIFHYPHVINSDVFSLFQNSMNLPPDKARLLRQYDNEKKWELICDQVGISHSLVGCDLLQLLYKSHKSLHNCQLFKKNLIKLRYMVINQPPVQFNKVEKVDIIYAFSDRGEGLSYCVS